MKEGRLGDVSGWGPGVDLVRQRRPRCSIKHGLLSGRCKSRAVCIASVACSSIALTSASPGQMSRRKTLLPFFAVPVRRVRVPEHCAGKGEGNQRAAGS